MTTHIVLVGNWLHDVGGVQTATRALADALEDRGHRVRRVSVLPGVAGSTDEIATLYPPSRLRRVLERGRVTTVFARLDLLGRVLAMRRLRRLARSADAVIAMDVFAAEVVAGAIPRALPFVVQFHNTATALDGTRDLQRLLRLRARVLALVALTEADAVRFRSSGFGSVVSIPNAVPPRVAPEVAADHLVVALGRYTAVKRFGMLIRAWSRLPAETKAEWRLELRGDGPELGSLQQAAATEPSITVLGPTPDVPSLLARASALVLPSAFEGLPMVLLEAMSSGVPCVATDSSPGVRELVSGAGWLVEVDDEVGLRDAISAAIADDGARARAAAEGLRRMERYAPAAVCRQWERLLAIGSPA